ncbi:hypothetical protein [uncultured Gimesia sp.]|uniref:hypothetical protein n=1 Tax=uncultured Gimesia sp. TaxID=1678688 RepID=UPI00262F7B7C|nr:hypothetical protein [uncultured Gimesia sp.]
MSTIMEKGVFWTSENDGLKVCKGCSYVAKTRRTVVEACSISVDIWCLLGTGELRFLSNSSEMRDFCSTDEVTCSHIVSGIISHSRATLNNA